jgi:polyphosphate glucokinase
MTNAEDVLTLGIDIGGTRLKCGILDANGKMLREQTKVETPNPATPEAVIAGLVGMITPLGHFDRISIGFPGVVRQGVVRTAPNLGTEYWRGYNLAEALQSRFQRPTRLLNDGSVQGLGVISGRGIECVITLGTGFGFALFSEGRLAPHLEMGQHPAHKDMTYDQYVGNAALQEVGEEKWNKRVGKAIANIETLTGFDTLYVGGGNAKKLTIEIAPNVHLVSNKAGITGGVKLWDPKMDEIFVVAQHELAKTDV